MASELKKPDAVSSIFPQEIPEKMWPLSMDLYMVGRATAPKLRRIGINTIGDFAKYDVDLLQYKHKSYGKLLWEYAITFNSHTISNFPFKVSFYRHVSFYRQIIRLVIYLLNGGTERES